MSVWDNVKLYYQNIFTNLYKNNERIIRDIVSKDCKPSNSTGKINLILYYQNQRRYQWWCVATAGQLEKLGVANGVYDYK